MWLILEVPGSGKVSYKVAGPARTSLGGWTVTAWWSEQDNSSTVTPCGQLRKLQCQTAGSPVLFAWYMEFFRDEKGLRILGELE